VLEIPQKREPLANGRGELEDENSRRLRRNLRICTWEGIAALPLVFLSLPANFIIAALLTKNFGLSEGWYGVIVSLPAWSNVLQLALIPLLARWLHAKALTLASAWAHLGCWLVFTLALPWANFENPTAAGLFFVGFFALSSVLAAIVGVSWTSWIQEWIPGKVRGKYFGNRNRVITFGTVAFLLISGKLLGWFDSSILGYQIVLFAAIFLRACSIVAQHRILASGKNGRMLEHYRWRDYPGILRQSPSLLIFIIFGGVFGFATGLIGPFYMLFMYDQIGLSVGQVSLMIIMASAGGAISFPAWGRLLDKHGNKPVMIFCLALWQLQNYLWCIITPANAWILYPMWLWGGITSAGYILGSFNLLLKLMPPQAKTTGISIYLGVTSLIAAIAPILGGLFFTWASAMEFDPLRTYHFSFLIQPTLCLLSCLILLKIHEPASAKVRTVVGAMRSMRQIGALFGLGFLVNYTFFKSRKTPEKTSKKTAARPSR
jgi:MFS family permease